MRKLKSTEEFYCATEAEAISLIENFRDKQKEEGYLLGANGYTYKSKKSKGEIIAEAYLVKVTKIYDEFWSEL